MLEKAMFLQILTEHQGHILIRIAVVVVMFSGFLLLFGYFNRRRIKTKLEDKKILNFGELAKRKNKKRWNRSRRRK